MLQLRNMKSLSNIKEFAILIFASFLISLAVVFFFGPHRLTPGGTTGMAISLSIISGVDVSLTSLMITIPLLVLGYFVLGSSYGIKTFIIILAVPFFTSILPFYLLIDSVILSSILGALLVGIGISLAIYVNCSTGGTDSIAMMLHKAFSKVKVSTWLLIVDGLVVISSTLLTGELMLAFYSAFALLSINIVIRISLKLFGVE